jgi:branched-chain amino acid transport system ATP-binding protein
MDMSASPRVAPESGLNGAVAGGVDPASGAGLRPLLQVEALEVSYGAVRAVRGVNLDVGEGDIVTLLGANGAGKSSTLNAIIGLAPRSGGRVLFEGRDISRAATESIVRGGMALVPEGRKLFQNMTVWENLRLGASALGLVEFETEMAGYFDLFPIVKTRAGEQAGLLSGGEQQQVAIARALLARPRLLLMDEPSLGLAPIVVGRVFEIIAELRRRGVTILLVEQNVERALKVADRGYVLASGKVDLSGPASELAAGAIEQAYLGIGTA